MSRPSFVVTNAVARSRSGLSPGSYIPPSPHFLLRSLPLARGFHSYRVHLRTRYMPSRVLPPLSRAYDTFAMGSMSRERPVDDWQSPRTHDSFSLKGRVIVITGGAKGIGLALGFAVAEMGASVAIIDAAPGPDSAAANLEKLCPKLGYYQSDVTDYEKLQGAFERIARDFGRVDGLITAAGICPDQRFLERDPAHVRTCLDINALGTYYSIRLAVAQILKSPLRHPGASIGSIVAIASIAAHQASKGQFTSDYCMSKGAVLSLTKQLGVEMAEYGIRVNCLSPGYISTDLTADLVKKRPVLGEIFNSQPPMKRPGNREDLKAAAVYLLSDASAYMTGAEMLITGGMHAGTIH